MAGTGAGPSRRSHTKSRKGCKTCKKRHIRCDETFPQCRNCTKHQVRCDYMENVGSDTEGQGSPEQPSMLLTPGSESRIDLWQQTGSFPYPDLQVFPPPQTHEYSKNELRLIHHLSSISNDLLLKGTSHLTVWTPKMSKAKRFLSIASSYPYVMHALLSFSANHLAWVHSSTDTRNLYLHHGSIALRGLHEAIGNFSHTNADAVLAASLLLLWQATDWRSWSSLRAGIQSVLSAMQSWKHESLFAEYVAEEDILATAFRQHQRRPSVDPTEKGVILQNAAYALQSLQSTLPGHELELHYINQLLVYIQQLQGLNPARTPDEQFNYLYQLRKWLFWIPVSLLQRQSGQGSALLTLAHFYAVALSLEPLFPDLGSSFCSATALPPLEAIIAVTSQMQTEHMNAASAEIASLMQYPRATAYNYRTRAMQFQQVKQEEQLMQPVLGFDPSALPFGNLSPAFAPSTPHYNVSHPTSAPASYLEVPSNASFSSNTQTWGVPSPSPGLPPQVYTTQEDQMYFGRFVQPMAIWT
ncbi:hypothetical protein LTR56_006745 [Elasticomyces elasticus]|nr:hypothetical protein LTR22_015496 [Elasticomyces elasticus]KAK3649562.1 hypothetical protein LTR56_006745 [Elasticomyces elasticus]KAK5754567.1 hypothetical protein LTS12_015404 [Elasticomyces elasticus]